MKSYITESALARIDLHLLRPYLMQRTDWQTFEKGFDGQSVGGVDGIGINTPMNGNGLGGAAETKGFRERLGMARLSTMMRELEGLGIGDTVSSNLSSGFSFARGFGGHGHTGS